MFLDSKQDFKEHIQNVLNKVSKTIVLLCKLQKILQRPPLITIKSILIYKCQYKSTRINTSQHESTRVRHESTRIKRVQHESTLVRHESTRINTSPTRVNTSQLDQKTIIVCRSFSW